MTIPEKAAAWAVEVAKDNSHGYDQGNRWGPDYDCSSLVISAYEAAGVPVKKAGASYTGNMRPAFRKCGFREVSGALKAGDVLLNEENHAALYIGGGQIVQASHNEKGAVTGGQSGDQTGGEIAVRGYYSYPWDVVLRYEGGGEPLAQKKLYDVKLPMLQRGDTGSAVLSVQLLLIHKWAISCGIDGADGEYGPATESAVRAFQRHKGLEEDGVAGPLTLAALIGQ